MKTTSYILALTLLGLLSACNTSVLYDPTMRMPARRLNTSEVQVTAAYGAIPESRPEYVGGRRIQHAVLADARAGMSKRVSLQARAWLGLENDQTFDDVRWGLGGSFLYAIDTTDTGWRTYLQPSAGFSAIRNTIHGFGGALNYIVYTPQLNSIQPYFSVGGLLGFSSETMNDWGLAPTLHLGSSWDFFQNVGLNIELATIVQININEDIVHPMLVPTIGFYVRP